MSLFSSGKKEVDVQNKMARELENADTKKQHHSEWEQSSLLTLPFDYSSPPMRASQFLACSRSGIKPIKFAAPHLRNSRGQTNRRRSQRVDELDQLITEPFDIRRLLLLNSFMHLPLPSIPLWKQIVA